MANHILLLDS